MRFVLIDRIVEIQPGKSLVAVKNLSLAEEYLADHFPGFPVMPGVLMLEALTQAGAWLVRDMEDFAHSVVILKQAKTIKYGSFVEPGRQLPAPRRDDRARRAREHASGRGYDRRSDDGQREQFTLTRYNLREEDPALHTTDASIVAGHRDLYATLRKGSVGARAMFRDGPTRESPAMLRPA